MAVEARHLNLFPPQILCRRDVMMNGMEGVNNMYAVSNGYGMSSMAPAAEILPPMYGSVMTESIPAAAKTVAMKADSGLTYAMPVVSRKRSREDNVNMTQVLPFGTALQTSNNCNNHRSSAASFSFLGEDLSMQIQQQQEIDRFVAQHTEKLRMEIEERRKRYSRTILASVEESILKRLKVKEEEIEKIGKLNWALEERVKSLSMENQIWRDLAQTNEATANTLRCNLENVLAQVYDVNQQRHHNGDAAAALADDADSCCGSNYNDETERRTFIENAAESNCNDGDGNGDRGGSSSNFNGGRLCRKCRKEEACVLLLPCRHLCLCAVCGSSLHTCPICKSTKNASLHVNMSS